MVGCITFVFGAVAECIIVKYISWRKAQIAKEQEERKKQIEDYWKSIGIDSKPKSKEKGTHSYAEFYKNMNGKEMMPKVYLINFLN